jgi:drug/metabolite transporter (DMT)-like permease
VTTPSPTRGRLLILTAAILWSTSGAFTNFLREPTALGLDVPRLTPLQIALGRALFAGLVLVPLLRPRDLTFRPITLATALLFTAMNATFISALALGKSANAILLQYTAPLWLFLAGVCGLGERADRRGVVALMAGLAGIAVIIAGGSAENATLPVLLGLGAGVTFAGVILGLRVQRDASPVWLTVFNHLFCAAALLPFVLALQPPTWPQVGFLAVYGALQMGIPYLLMTRGLRDVSSQEAGTLTLLEPLLTPVWAYLVAPAKEKPNEYIFLGGALILLGLVYRYWPGRPPASDTVRPG